MVTWVAGACAAGAAAVAVAELAARLIIRKRGRYFVNLPSTKTVLDLEPSVSEHLEPRVRIEINSRGERGCELVSDPSETLCVAVVGGSASYCYLTDQPSSWPEKMATYLRERNVGALMGRSCIHVGNLSQSELTSAGAKLIVDHILTKRAALDAVIVVIGMSDMARWLRYGAPERLPTQTADEVFAVHPEGPFSWRPKSTALAEAARRGRERWRCWRTPTTYRKNVGNSVLASRLRRRNALKVIHDVPDPMPMLTEYRRNLSAIIQTLLARNVVVLVLGQPLFGSSGRSEFELSHVWNGGVGDPRTEPITTYYSEGVLDELSRQVNAAAEEVASDLGVAYLDLEPYVPDDLAHYYDQLHFTPAGADAVARAAAEALAKALSGR